jgi:hypothetical protein
VPLFNPVQLPTCESWGIPHRIKRPPPPPFASDEGIYLRCWYIYCQVHLHTMSALVSLNKYIYSHHVPRAAVVGQWSGSEVVVQMLPRYVEPNAEVALGGVTTSHCRGRVLSVGSKLPRLFATTRATEQHGFLNVLPDTLPRLGYRG